MIEIRYHRLFGDDVSDAYQWYENQRSGLGEDLLLCIEETLGKITVNPQIGVLVTEDVHRLLIRRYPYGLYYRITRKEILIIALRHLKRKPLSRFRKK